jgi:hypothetical protein
VSPTNAAIHRLSVAAGLGEVAEALPAAAGVDPDNLPEGVLSRRAQMHLALAWAQSQRKRDGEAVLHGAVDAQQGAYDLIGGHHRQVRGAEPGEQLRGDHGEPLETTSWTSRVGSRLK